MPLSFAVTWDYRCPFARNVHSLLVEALDTDPDWDLRFVPFSLSQAHVADGETDVWDDPLRDSGLLALQVGVAVRDQEPARFPAVHRDLFALRHERGRDLRDASLLRGVLDDHGIDADAVFAAIDEGGPLDTIRKEHEAAASDHHVWGVPTFLVGEDAVFVRLMHGATGDPAASRTTIERLVAMTAGWPSLNEFKHTSIPH
ncbi:MAG: DsbA family protein [Acidimicrobiales bacterium]|nr:DsbA family protein [Acidimicrobiales bacterium]